MKVRAIQNGFYQGRLRVAGEEFVLAAIPGKNKEGKTVLIEPADQYSHVWMEVVDGSPVPPKKRNVGWDQAFDFSVQGELGGKPLSEWTRDELCLAINTVRAIFGEGLMKMIPAPAQPEAPQAELAKKPETEKTPPTGDKEVL